MSFRKRNISIVSSSSTSRIPPLSSSPSSPPSTPFLPPPPPRLGTRPSPVDGRPCTSTGTHSLDSLLAGHGGLAVGTSLLIGENGTTDYAGALLRFYAAEGVVQGQTVHVVAGAGSSAAAEAWARDLPGLCTDGEEREGVEKETVRMKIAWRYERSERATMPTSTTGQAPFCHRFDLTKRLSIPSPSPLRFIPLSSAPSTASPYLPVLEHIVHHLASSPPHHMHRLVIPTLLHPLLYPPHAREPHHLLQFLHALRGLLRRHASQLTAMITLPLDLYPRATGLVRWMELLSDGVLELTPFPHSFAAAMPEHAGPDERGASPRQHPAPPPPQGILHVHRLPVFHERGGGGGGAVGGRADDGTRRLGEDLAFTLSRRHFVIRPFSLPPVHAEVDAREAESSASAGGRREKMADLDF
ncbi:MAG: hypothetical protein M1826_007040 [Phylliscum demangeonii]|nr:MAG: hypothetical protein M1826_007040 [Phylliscum demangeonii]